METYEKQKIVTNHAFLFINNVDLKKSGGNCKKLL